MRNLLISTALLFSFYTLAYGQNATLHYNDGTLIKASAIFPVVKIQMKYGVLEVPVKDIYNIKVGYHCEDTLKLQIENALNNLGSSVYKNRAEADEFLRKSFTHSYYLMKSFETKDVEVKKRIDIIMGFIRENKRPAEYERLAEDHIYLTDGSVYKGRLLISSKDFRFKSLAVGEFEGKLPVLNMIMMEHLNKSLIYDAKQIVDDEWIDSGIVVLGHFKINAYGLMDMCPETPNQYVTSPRGNANSAMGRGQIYPYGLLLARFEGSEEIIRVGDFYQGFTEVPVRLHFKVICHPWQVNFPPTGQYQIQVR